MKHPEYWQPPRRDNQQTAEASASHSFVEIIKVVGCVIFMIASCVFWFTISSSSGRVIYTLLLAIPNYACGEWLATKLFRNEPKESTSQKSLSLIRVLYGLLLVLALFSLIYAIALFANWI